jgi:NADH-quinone oxidoreductase subunit H
MDILITILIIAAYVQDRVGPNRVGPWGLLQPIVDGVKFVLKEQTVPQHVNTVIYFIAPTIAVLTTSLAFAVVPFGPPVDPQQPYRFIIAPNVDIGIVFIFSIGSLAVYAIILGGWSSNNKYSLLGAIRSSAQVISYEIPLGLSILGVVLMAGSLNLERIVWNQAMHGFWHWNFWQQPLAGLIFFAAAMAESNRLPFDLPEAEQELVGGYHTEYSSMKFAFFFLGEYTHMITVSFLMAILFFGGWHFPLIANPESHYVGATIVKILVLFTKVAFFIVFMMFLRWTLPRFRFDQLMQLAWQVLIPLALLNFVAVMFVKHFALPPWVLLPINVVLFVGAGFVSLLFPEEGRPAVTVNGTLHRKHSGPEA